MKKTILLVNLILFIVPVLCWAQESACVNPGESMNLHDLTVLNRQCCDGFEVETNYNQLDDGICVSPSDAQSQDKDEFKCLKCRDGICDKEIGENGCNCPYDCKNFKCKKHGQSPLFTRPDDDMGVQCCENLKHSVTKESFDDNCASLSIVGYAGICLECGDGDCDQSHESPCNCPEDCKP